MAGLLIGKTAWYSFFCYLSVMVGLCKLPAALNFRHIIGVGFLGGIGFTMSIFITLLAFDDTALIIGSKLAIFAASFFAGIIGFFYLKHSL